MKLIHMAPLAIGALMLSFAPGYSQSAREEASEKPVALSSVPQPAIDAARRALGTSPTEARIVPGTSPQQYELEARNTTGGEAGVHVTADGTVIKRENETSEKGERGER